METVVRRYDMPRKRWLPVRLSRHRRESFGSKLRAMREQRRLTHAEVQAAIGVSASRLSAWENDRGVPSQMYQRALERFYGLERNTLSNLIEDLDDALPSNAVAIPDDEPLVGAVKRLYVLEDDQLQRFSRFSDQALRTLADLSEEEWQAFLRGMRGLGDQLGEVETLDDMDDPDEGEAPAPKRRRTAG